jgi:iron complex outermembrane recepter protein
MRMQKLPTASIIALTICLMHAAAEAREGPHSSGQGTQPSSSGGSTQNADDTTVEIVVTAQSRSARMQDVPIAIASVDAAQLQNRRIENVADLKTVVPSLSVVSSSGHALPSLRGVGTSLIGPGFENPVAFYVDGVYYADASSALLSFNNVARIDVLKGPQGTLFGRNATGGLIQITTLEPKQTPTMRASLSYGNYQTIETKAYVTGGILPNLAADLAVRYGHQGHGYGKNLAMGQDVNRTDQSI